MKVLHIISSSGMYGAEAVILNLSRTLAEGSHHSCIGVFSNSSNPDRQLYDAALKAGLETHLIPCTGQFDRSSIACIRSLIAQTGCDVVHAHGYKADIYTYLALRGQRTPLISTCHTWYDTDWIVSLYGKIDRFVLRNFTRVVSVSDEVTQRLLRAGVSKQKIHMVRNGIDLRPFHNATPSLQPDGSSDHPLLVGLIGRLAWEKGIDIFLTAAARVVTALPATQFVIVGEGPDRDKLEHTIDSLNIRANVSMLGRRDDMPAVYASLDVMVSSSRQEGLPMAILEGMASGLPLVATSVGEVPTVIQDGRTGLLMPACDTDLLAAKILELLRDPAQRARLGAAARQLIQEEYSAERMTADYLRVYDEAITAVNKGRINSSAPSQGGAA